MSCPYMLCPVKTKYIPKYKQNGIWKFLLKKLWQINTFIYYYPWSLILANFGADKKVFLYSCERGTACFIFLCECYVRWSEVWRFSQTYVTRVRESVHLKITEAQIHPLSSVVATVSSKLFGRSCCSWTQSSLVFPGLAVWRLWSALLVCCGFHSSEKMVAKVTYF